MRTLVAVSLFAAAAVAETDQKQRLAEMVSRGVVYRVKGMDKVELRNDVAYKKAGARSLFADVYIPRPRKDDAQFPAVILIHGATPDDVPVKPKDWGIYRSWGELLAASGFVAVAFNHRLGFADPRHGEAASDVADMIALLRENAEYFHVNEGKICLAAFSAGGPLLTAAMRERPQYIKCLVSYYNILEEKLPEFSPLAQLDREPARLPPMFIARAGRDEIPHLLESLDRFVQKAMQVNAPVTVMNHPVGPHGFDTQRNDARSREIVKATIEFLKWHLR